MVGEFKRSSIMEPVTEGLPPEKEAGQGLWGNRTQFQNPTTDQWIKRDKVTGQIMEVKDEPYQAVPQEH